MQKLRFINGNGVEVDLTDKVNYGIIEWEGFSADGLNIQSQQVPFQDGGVFLDALMEQRELSVTVAINAKGDLDKRYRLRRELISVLNPKLGEGVLIYTDNYLSKQIHVIPQIPLFDTNNSNDSGTPKVSCSFTACNPYWEDMEEKEVTINNFGEVEIINEGDVPAQIQCEINVTEEAMLIENYTTNKILNTQGKMTGEISISTEVGKKSIYITEKEYNILFGGLYNGGTVTRDNLILVGGNVAKINFVTKALEIINTNLTVVLNDITYSPTLNMYVGIASNKIFTSYDLQYWVERYSGGVGDTVSWEDSLFKVFLYGSNILTSTDGINWITETGTINKNKTQCFFNDNYYRINSGTIQQSPNGSSSWTTIYNDKYIKFIIVFNNMVVGVGRNANMVSSTNGTTWNTLFIGGYIFDSLIAFNKFYLIMNNTFLLMNNRTKTFSNIFTLPSGEYVLDVLYKNFILVMTNKAIYKSTDGVSFTKVYSIPYEISQGNLLFAENYYCAYYEKINFVRSINGTSWSAYGFHSVPDYNRMDTNKMVYFNGNYYIGMVASRGDETYVYYRIIKSADLETFTEVFMDSEIADVGITKGYADENYIIFLGMVGRIIISQDGNTFTEKNYSNTLITMNNVKKINGKYYIFGYMKNYLSTEDFSSYEELEPPQKITQQTLGIEKYNTILYSYGYITQSTIDGAYLGYEGSLVKKSIIDRLSADSDISFNLKQGNNLIYVQGSSDTVAKIKFRQKYIGV